MRPTTPARGVVLNLPPRASRVGELCLGKLQWKFLTQCIPFNYLHPTAVQTLLAYLGSLVIHGLVLTALWQWSSLQSAPTWSWQNDHRLCIEMEAELAALTHLEEAKPSEVILEHPLAPEARPDAWEEMPVVKQPVPTPTFRHVASEISIEDFSQQGDPAPQVSPPERPPRTPPPTRSDDPAPTARAARQATNVRQAEASNKALAATAPTLPVRAASDAEELPQSSPTNPKPPYPARALAEGLQGVVYLRVAISATGAVTDVQVHRSSGVPALDASALTTVRTQWRFTPARHGGVPVDSEALLPIRFVIRWK